PTDTGEALGSPASNLTLSFGFGPTLFARPDGTDRFGLQRYRPEALADLPAFAGDRLDPARSGGDLAVQACADDPLVAFHAVHNLVRIARGVATLRWNQTGFASTSGSGRDQPTPRNLMGNKDGTNNIDPTDTATMADQVWVGDEGPSWMAGGTYLVARRIRMLLDEWDRSSLDEQHQTIGRFKASGAPLTGQDEHDAADLDALDPAGRPVISSRAHIRLAAPSTNGGVRILRRGFSFHDGVDRDGRQDAGLFFVSFQRDPHHFVTIQQRLAGQDALNTYIRHTSSAVFACPPGLPDGVSGGDWLGRALFEA
ncbi:MAG TPA: Dyp-type peroxidase, partial [Acidimicrobiales bacterium]